MSDAASYFTKDDLPRDAIPDHDALPSAASYSPMDDDDDDDDPVAV
jgi:hypothetical protein